MDTQSHYRFERKYSTTRYSSHQVEALVNHHPALFREIFHPRSVNNMYWDTIGLGAYFEHTIGSYQRTKTRVRWYGDLYGTTKSPKLELKKKNTNVGYKKRYPLENFHLQAGDLASYLYQEIVQDGVHPEVKQRLASLTPTLINSYKRKYFRSLCGRFRITIDSDVSCYPLLGVASLPVNGIKNSRLVIIELKYSHLDDLLATEIADSLPFTLTRNSKYINGLQLLYNWVR